MSCSSGRARVDQYNCGTYDLRRKSVNDSCNSYNSPGAGLRVIAQQLISRSINACWAELNGQAKIYKL